MYENFRPKIRSGDLLAWSGNRAVSRFIRGWTGATYSHVGIAWVVGGRVFVIEAKEFRGVDVRLLSSTLPCYWIPTGVEWTDSIEEEVLSHLNAKYSYMDALRAGFGFAPKYVGWQCAEFAAYVLNFAGFQIDLRFDTPAELVAVAMRAGKPNTFLE